MAAINSQYDCPTFSDADLAKYPYLAELPERCPCDKICFWNYKSGHPINEHVKTCVAWKSLQHKRKAAAKEGKTHVPQMLFFSQRCFNETIKGGELNFNPQPGCGSALCPTVLAVSTPQFLLEEQKHLA